MKVIRRQLKSCNIYLFILLIMGVNGNPDDWEKQDFDIFVKLNSTRDTSNDSGDNGSGSVVRSEDINPSKASKTNPVTLTQELGINPPPSPYLIVSNGIYSGVRRFDTEEGDERTELPSNVNYGESFSENVRSNREIDKRTRFRDRTMTSSYSSIRDVTRRRKNSKISKRKVRYRPGKRARNSKKTKTIKSPPNDWLPRENEIGSFIENGNEEMIGVFKVKRKQMRFASPFPERKKHYSRNILGNEIKENRASVARNNIANNQSDEYIDSNVADTESESSYSNTYVPVPDHYPFINRFNLPGSSRQYRASDVIGIEDSSGAKAKVIGPLELAANSFAPKAKVLATATANSDFPVPPPVSVTPHSESESQNIEMKMRKKENDSDKKRKTKTAFSAENEKQDNNYRLENPLPEPYFKYLRPDSKTAINSKVYEEFQEYYNLTDKSILGKPRTYESIGVHSAQDLGRKRAAEMTETPKKKDFRKLSKILTEENALKSEISAGLTTWKPPRSPKNPDRNPQSPVYPATFEDQSQKHDGNLQPLFLTTFTSYKSVLPKGKTEIGKTALERKTENSGKSEKSPFGNRKEAGKYKENGQIYQRENFGHEENGNRDETKRKPRENQHENALQVVSSTALSKEAISRKEKKAIKNAHPRQPPVLGGVLSRDPKSYPPIPRTSFNCRDKMIGYYGDPEAECQVFHMCHHKGRMDSFLCPEGTLFNQKLLTCDYNGNVDCLKTLHYYNTNELLSTNHIDHHNQKGKNKFKPLKEDDHRSRKPVNTETVTNNENKPTPRKIYAYNVDAIPDKMYRYEEKDHNHDYIYPRDIVVPKPVVMIPHVN